VGRPRGARLIVAPPAAPGVIHGSWCPLVLRALWGFRPAARPDPTQPHPDSRRLEGAVSRRDAALAAPNALSLSAAVGAAVPLAGGMGLSGYGWWSPRSTSLESSPSDLAHAHQQPALHPRPGRLGRLRSASDGPALTAAPARFDEVASTRSDEAERDLVTGGGRVVDEGDLAGGAAIPARTAGNREMPGIG
jgi:hypothetical protein